MKNKIITFSYTFLLYLAVLMIPFSRWIKDINMVIGLEIISKLFLIIFIVYDLFFVDKRKFNIGKFNVLYFPLIIGLISNWITLLTNSFSININRDVLNLVLSIFNTLLVAIIEEIIFRELIFDILYESFIDQKNKDYLVIAFSSIIFSIGHSLNFIVSDPIVVLTQMGYTFILGLIIGCIRIKSNSLIICIIGHFLFNSLNSNLFDYFINITPDYTYYLISSVIGITLIIYTFIISFYDKKGEHSYAS